MDKFEKPSLYGFAECVLEMQETVCRAVSSHNRMVVPRNGFEKVFDACQGARAAIQELMQEIRYGEVQDDKLP